jgi:hypothetical protein
MQTNNTRRGKMKKLILVMAAIALLCLGGIAQADIDSSTAPVGYQATGYTLVGHSDVLLVQDVLPWNGNANAGALMAHEASYSVISSSMLSTFDMSGYRAIMYASDQQTSFYQNVATNLGRIESFVAGGGTLIAHSCDMGWNVGDWSGLSILPGSVGHVRESSQNIHIVDTSHPVMSNLDDAYLYNWNFSTHGYFTDLPEGAQVVAVKSGTEAPTYIDYQWGSGRVLATMQTVEWGYWGNNVSRPYLLDNEISYALGVSPTYPEPSIPEPATLSLLALGGLALIRRRKP